MQRYEKYKDSGVEWLGEIPEDWEVKRLKYVVTEHSGNGFPNSKQGNKIADVPFYKVSDINGRSGHISKANNYVSLKVIIDNSWNIVPKYSVIAAKIGEALKKNHRKITLLDCIIDNNCIALEAKGIDYKYNFYLLSIVDFVWFVNLGAVPSLSVEKFKSFKISVPGRKKEQTAIANYLDHKTAEIDQLIVQKERLLDLYEEEKTAIINSCVTRGINPDVKLKDSGIEWLGEIPEGWEVRRMATLGTFSKGKGIPRSELKEKGCPAILYGDIYTKYSIKADFVFNRISEETAETSIKIKFGDILFTGSGETREDIGKSITYVGNEQVYVGGDVIIFRQNEERSNSLFLSYSLNSNGSIYQKSRAGKGQIIVHIYSANLREIVLPYPSIDEQTAIVQHIETETTRINAKISKTEKIVALQKEYRTALISEVVTGQIKVTQEVA